MALKKFMIFSAVMSLLILIPIASVILTGGIYQNEKNEIIEVFITDESKVEKMSVTQYLKEVVAAEMPAEFEFEALKAQAVAARTYLKSRTEQSKKSEISEEHQGAVICTDYKHCAAWIREDKRKALWEADKAAEYWNKISEAVEQTKGEIITYDKKPISAVFHSVSSGKTECARDVWGGDMPYLVSVDSPGDETSPKYYAEKQLSVSEFTDVILKKHNDANISLPPFENAVRSKSGGIISVDCYGVHMKGTDLRSLFELRSTNAELEIADESITIKTKGNGHGVGMSQYGADYMAKQGKNYREILLHYYSGVEISESDI